MHHAAKYWEGGFGNCQRAGRGHRSTTPRCPGAKDSREHVRLAAASKFPPLFCGPACFLDWHLDAKYRPRLVSIPAYGLKTVARSRCGGGVDANDAVLDLGRLGGR